MASTSYSYTSNDHVFDAFINHRGPDSKETLAKDLYDQLKHELRVFLDVGELQPGEEITPQIESAIRTAKVHIAIFSKRYCESSWCLNELFLMLQSGSPILPIFYGVKPSVLRLGTQGENGVYAQALHRLEEKRTVDSQLRYDSNTIEKWREALSKCADISGFDLETFNGDERQLLQQVVEVVLKIAKLPVHVSEHPTGLDEKVKDFEETVSLQRQSSETRVIGIVGLGGVGKTTLAKEIFNRRRSNFKKSCYLRDVRETALTSLQGRLLEDLTQWNGVQINSPDEGIEKLKRHLSCHAFIVLDDVDHVQQLDALLSPVKDVLHQCSLIIVTSRNMDVLRKWGIVESSIFKLTGLHQQHSRELFCWHAFNQPNPRRDFEQIVEHFLASCDGLPLSLKVLGALLHGEDLKYWKAQLHRISQILPEDIQSRLKISYDCLDKLEKQIFLDIVCFFIGNDRDTAIRIWDGTEWGGWLGFRNLERRCIVEVDSDNRIRMHDHMRDMGRAVAEDERPRRLWRPTHNLRHLSENSHVRGISNVHLQGCEKKLTGYMSGLQLFCAEDYFVEGKFMKRIFRVAKSLIWLCWFDFPYSCLPPWISLKTLRVLRIKGSKLESLWLNESQAPTQLRELYIQCDGCLKFPESIGKLKHLEKLVVQGNDHLILTVSSLDELCHLQSLKHLDLTSSRLKTLPDSFGNLTNLEYMNLSHHYFLERLPDSFGNLTNVTYVDLSRCYSLQRLPDSFGNLTNVTRVDLSLCSSLQMLPDSFGNLTNATRVHLSCCFSLQMLPDSFGNLTNATRVHLSYCSSLQMLPDSFGNLTNVTRVHLSYCSSLQMLPDSFGNLTNVTHVDLSYCSSLQMLPDSFGNLTNATHVDLSYCSSLQMLPDSFGNLTNATHVDLSGCSSLQMIPDSFGNLTNLRYLRLRECSNLQKLPDSFSNLNQLCKLEFDIDRSTVSSELREQLRQIIDRLPHLYPYFGGTGRNLKYCLPRWMVSCERGIC